MKLLILGGTTEARHLAAACADALPELTTVTSLAGRTSSPLVPAGELRIGGFGGVPGLAAYLRSAAIDLIVDATHPFAATMSTHAAEAAAATDVPLLRLQRPGWTETAGDRWHRLPTLEAAAAFLGAERAEAASTASPSAAARGFRWRVFLTTGRQEIAAFAGLDDCWFLARSVEPPEPPMPRHLEVLLDRGPFSEAGERALLADHCIDVLVTKDSGGPAAKLAAARAEGIPVLMIARPPMPPVETVPTVEAATAWVAARQLG
jgi:precorrin-6A/cobalt-precorrin-6A reductase